MSTGVKEQGKIGDCMASRAPSGPYIIDVMFEKRADGGLRAYCDKVPGFVLSHADPEAVFADVIPALETIISAMYDCCVKVSLAHQVGEEDEPLLPAYMCNPRQYVAQSNAH